MAEEIGSGAYGTVYKVYTDKRHCFAMKVIDKKRLAKKKLGKPGAPNPLQILKTELAVWKKVRHQNCLQLIEVIDDPSK